MTNFCGFLVMMVWGGGMGRDGWKGREWRAGEELRRYVGRRRDKEGGGREKEKELVPVQYSILEICH